MNKRCYYLIGLWKRDKCGCSRHGDHGVTGPWGHSILEVVPKFSLPSSKEFSVYGKHFSDGIRSI